MPGDDIKNKSLAKKSLEKYTNSTISRASVQLIPYVGGALDTIMCGAASKLYDDRIEKTVSSIERRLSHLESVDPLPLTDELYDLFVKIFESSVKTRSDQKRKCFAEILGGKIEGNKTSEEAEQYIRMISDLDDIHIKVLQQVSNAKNTGFSIGGTETWASVITKKPRGAGMDSPTVLTNQLPNYTESSIVFACSELASRGLLSDLGSLPTVDGIYDRHETLNYYAITKFGRLFINSLPLP